MSLALMQAQVYKLLILYINILALMLSLLPLKLYFATEVACLSTEYLQMVGLNLLINLYKLS